MEARACIGTASYVAGLQNVGLFWHFLYETWNFTMTATIIIGYLMGRGAA